MCAKRTAGSEVDPSGGVGVLPDVNDPAALPEANWEDISPDDIHPDEVAGHGREGPAFVWARIAAEDLRNVPTLDVRACGPAPVRTPINPTAGDFLNRPEAARYLRISVRHFDAVVRPALTPTRIGRRIVFNPEELRKWADQSRGGTCANAGGSTSCTSRIRGDLFSEQPGDLTLKELRRSRPKSTQPSRQEENPPGPVINLARARKGRSSSK